MPYIKTRNYEKLADSTPLPIKNPRHILHGDPENILDIAKMNNSSSICCLQRARNKATVAPLKIGEIKCIALKTTPCVVREQDGHGSTLALHFFGGKCRHRQAVKFKDLNPGDAVLSPRIDCTVEVGYFSGIICDIDHTRLQRAIRSLSSGKIQWNSKQ